MTLPAHIDQKLCFKRYFKSSDVPYQTGANGEKLCRWCLVPVQKPRRSWCSEACAEEFKVRIFGSYAAHLVLKRDGSKCTICGDHGHEVDHIVPVVEGGGCCGLDNLRTLCSTCHRNVTAELRKRLSKKRKANKVQSALDRLKGAECQDNAG